MADIGAQAFAQRQRHIARHRQRIGARQAGIQVKVTRRIRQRAIERTRRPRSIRIGKADRIDFEFQFSVRKTPAQLRVECVEFEVRIGKHARQQHRCVGCGQSQRTAFVGGVHGAGKIEEAGYFFIRVERKIGIAAARAVRHRLVEITPIAEGKIVQRAARIEIDQEFAQ